MHKCTQTTKNSKPLLLWLVGLLTFYFYNIYYNYYDCQVQLQLPSQAVKNAGTSEHTHTVHVRYVIDEPGFFHFSFHSCRVDTGNSLSHTTTEKLEMHYCLTFKGPNINCRMSSGKGEIKEKRKRCGREREELGSLTCRSYLSYQLCCAKECHSFPTIRFTGNIFLRQKG